jgi:hypothetical protein
MADAEVSGWIFSAAERRSGRSSGPCVHVLVLIVWSWCHVCPTCGCLSGRLLEDVAQCARPRVR